MSWFMITITQAYHPSNLGRNRQRSVKLLVLSYYSKAQVRLNVQIHRKYMNLPKVSSNENESSLESLSRNPSVIVLQSTLYQGLANIYENVPKPILVGIAAVVSGMLFFEMSKLILVMGVPLIIVLGGMKSIGYKLEDLVAAPKVFDTNVINERSMLPDDLEAEVRDSRLLQSRM